LKILQKVNQYISKWQDWVLLFVLSITWGSSFILIKKALVTFNEIEVASLRIAVATLISIPIVIIYFKQIEWRKWHYFLVVGLVGNGMPPFLFATGQTEVSSSLAGVLNTLTPIFTLIFAILFFSQKLNIRNVMGVIIGLIGILLIAYAGNAEFEGSTFYISLIVIATVLYALNINAVKFFFKNTKPIIIIAVSFVLFGPFSFLILGSESFIETVQTHPFAIKSLLAIIVLASLSTVLATMLFFRLLQRTNTVFASSVSYVIPLVAVVWGLIDGEPFKFIYFISLALILAGVYLTRK
jgi:drug/metabolite transporter (DMT)-like permease